MVLQLYEAQGCSRGMPLIAALNQVDVSGLVYKRTSVPRSAPVAHQKANLATGFEFYIKPEASTCDVSQANQVPPEFFLNEPQCRRKSPCLVFSTVTCLSILQTETLFF